MRRRTPRSARCASGLPGALPVVNEKAVESAIRIGLALGCSIAEWSRFARKNYFYPDMPKDFQTSQYDEPIAFDGALEISVETEDGPRSVTVGIERAHMEEDTGKISHVGGATGRIHGADYSLIDYNRAGVPLIEIVTKPIEVEPALAPAVARAYVTELRELIVALGVSDAHMHQGSMRVDANVSLKPRGRRVRDPHRDQERQLDPLGRARGSLRDPAAGGRAAGRWHDRAGDPALPRERRHRPPPDG